MAASGPDLFVTDSFSPTQNNLLAYPAWLDYPRLEATARRILKKGRFEERAAISSLLFKVWRLPEHAPLLSLVLDYELQQSDFVAVLQERGAPQAVCECLRLLISMANPVCAEADFVLAHSALEHWRKALAAGLGSQEIVPSAPWSLAEQRERLMALAIAWQAHALVGAYRWQWQEEFERDIRREREQAQARRDRELAVERERTQQAEQSAQAQARLEQLFNEAGFSPDAFPEPLFTALQSGAGARDFLTVHGRGASAAVLRDMYALSEAAYRQLQGLQSQREAQLKAERAQRWEWEQACIGAEATMALLGITRSEYEIWLADKRLPAVRLERGRAQKKGRAALMHHPEELAQLTPELIESWRVKDMAGMNSRQRNAYQRSVDRARTQWMQAQVLERMEQQFSCHHEPDPDDATRLRWLKDVFLPIYIAGLDRPEWRANVQLAVALPLPRTQAEQERLPARLELAFGSAVQKRLISLLQDTVEGFLSTQRPMVSASAYRDLQQALRQVLEDGVSQESIQAGNLDAYLRYGPVKRILDQVEQQRAQDMLRLGDYPQTFTLARAIRRHIVFRLGPTNSGKTHEALEALMEARSGVYLAPLRLLAMEVRDRLTEAGIPCNLITGEERVMVPGAQHTACTVEMLDPSMEVRVAVLDEVQMLADEQRGWAWTAALVGMPARTLFVCGDQSVLEPCLRVVQALEESHEIEYTQRKTPLEVMAQVVQAPRIKREPTTTQGSGRRQRQKETVGVAKGDAVIAFTRKDVLTLSARYRAQGLSVASIYGALAPEVRRTESERFATGVADVMVATDAIGMGLNLPIRRVIFSTAWKFDGRRMRPLSATEVRQIGGRAGRYGLYPKGYVGAMDQADLNHIRQMLDEPVQEISLRLPIAPAEAHILALADLLNTQSIGVLLQYFANKVASDSPLFQTAGLKDTIELGFWVDRLAGQLSLTEKFSFACAPVSVDKDHELDYYKRCLRAYVERHEMQMPAVPSWMKASSPARLEDAEMLSKQISLYAWLSMKFPDVYYQFRELLEFRSQLSRFIERSLLHQSGFGKTSKEAFGGA